MKRILKGLVLAFVAVLGVTLVSCGETPEPTGQPTPLPPHVHSFEDADAWLRDSATHWKECMICEEVVQDGLHDYGAFTLDEKECKQSRTCKVCGFVQTQDVKHTWGEWTAQEDGSMAKECSHCHKVESVAQYYVKGAIAGNSGIVWGQSDAGKLVIDYEKMTAKLTVTLAVGDQFKVGTAEGWEFNIDNVEFTEGLFVGNSDGNLVAQEAADYEIILSGLDGSEHKCTVNQLCVHTYEWTLVTGKTCEYTGVCTKCQGTSSKVEHAGYGEWTLVAGKTCDYEQVCECGDKKTKVEHTWGDDIVCDKCQAVNVVQYYIKGSVASVEGIVWGASDAGKLTLNDDKKSAYMVLTLAVGDQFKVATENGWEFNAGNVTINVPGIGGTDNIECTAAGVYVVNITGLDTTTPAVSIDPVALYVRGDQVGSWDAQADYKLAYDKATDKATITLEISDITKAFKIADADWSDAFNFGGTVTEVVLKGDNIVVPEAGYWVITVSGVSTGAPTCTIVKGEGTVEPEVIPVPDMYIAGSHNGWAEAFKSDSNKLGLDYKGENASISLYLAANTEFKVTSSDWSFQYGFGATGLTYAEGLFTDQGGNLKVATSGIYTIKVSGLADKTKATCTITLDYAEMSIADAKAAAADTKVLVSGTVKSIDGKTIVLTDGAQTPTELNVYSLVAHVHVGDIIAVTGKMGAYNEVPQVASPKLYNVISQTVINYAEQQVVTSVDQLFDGAQVIVTYNGSVMGANLVTSKGVNYREYIATKNNLEGCAQVVTLVKAGDNWMLKVGENEYLYAKDENGISTGNVTDDTAKWTIAIKDGVTTITNVSLGERLLQANLNSGQERFAAYKGTQQNPTLVLVDSSKFNLKADPYAQVATSGNVFSVKATADGGNSYTLGNGYRLYVVVDAKGRIAYMCEFFADGYGNVVENSYARHSMYADKTQNPAFANIGTESINQWGSLAFDLVVPEGGFALSIYASKEFISLFKADYEKYGVNSAAYNVDSLRVVYDEANNSIAFKSVKEIEFREVTTSDAGTTLTENFKTAETVTVDGVAYNIGASSSNMLVENVNYKGLKLQKEDTSVSFTTTETADITFIVYISDASRTMVIKQDGEQVVTGFTKNCEAVSTAEYSYEYISNSQCRVTLHNAAAGTYSIAAAAKYTVYVCSIEIATSPLK